jgi:hypothetical protein
MASKSEGSTKMKVAIVGKEDDVLGYGTGAKTLITETPKSLRCPRCQKDAPEGSDG